MALDDEIQSGRKEIVADGYDMSFGEVMNLYRDGELKIDPAFQRLFRWEPSQKTHFIESILLGIPLPPIFVYQNEDGIWELIDGLQRISTLLQFVGLLERPDGSPYEPLRLDGTRLLPSLYGKTWDGENADDEEPLSSAHKIMVKRARIRVEILKSESDTQAKYELFQRLNTGGTRLSPQEVRNCIAVMLNEDFHSWLKARADNVHFKNTTAQTENALESQQDIELVLRFVVFRHFQYDTRLDVHEYLNDSLIQLATHQPLDYTRELEIFEKTFEILDDALGNNAFKKWDGNGFRGKFLLSVFEVMVTGISLNLDQIEGLGRSQAVEHVRAKAKELWDSETFQKYSGPGVRGTQRLRKLLPFAESFLKP